MCASIRWGEQQRNRDEVALPTGLQIYLDARRAAAEGNYREAIDLYAEAARVAPEIDEIRIAYASLLLMVGLPDSAVEMLRGRENLDWYGMRVLAMALAQASSLREEYLEPARDALREALEERSDDANLQFALARILRELGEIREAEEVVADLRRSRSNSARILALHAQLLSELGRSAEAAELYRQCADGTSAEGVCREGLVQALIASGRPGAAGEALISWLEPDDLDRLLQAAALLSDGGRSAQALEVVRRVLSRVPDSPRAQTLEALLLTDLERYAEAAPRLDALLKKNRDDVDLLMASAWSAFAEGQGSIDDARRYLDRAWEQVAGNAASPRAVRVTLNAARLELSAGHPTMAREWLQRIGDLEVGGAQALALLVESYKVNERYDEGASALLRLEPTLPERLRPVAMAFETELRYRGGRPSSLRRLEPLFESKSLPDVLVALQVLQSLELWSRVVEVTDLALDTFPSDRSLRFARAVGLERLDQMDEAAEVFSAILADDPDDANVANYLGYMWADAGVRLEEADELISRAVQQEPENPAYLDSLGWVRYRLGRLEEARRWLQRAVELGGDRDGTVLAHLGEVLFALGEVEDARRLLQASLDLGCENPELVKELLARLERDDDELSEDGSQ